MSVDDFDEWMDVAEALDLDRQIDLMQCLGRSKEYFDRVQNQKFILLGDNPFLPDYDKLKEEQNQRKAEYYARKNGRERNQSETVT